MGGFGLTGEGGDRLAKSGRYIGGGGGSRAAELRSPMVDGDSCGGLPGASVAADEIGDTWRLGR